jgi:sugar/nucleoside kinase (ribokinase family)
VLAPLHAAGVDCSRVRTAKGARTRAAVIVVERSGERAVLGYRDARLAAEGAALASLPLDGARLLLLDASDLPLALALARRARAGGVPVVLDLDTPSAEHEALLACVPFPVVSEVFARRAYGSAEATLARLVALGARLPVVTLGPRGALGAWQGRVLASPAFRVDAVDTTGAGDVFHGAFAWGLLRGLGAGELLRIANAAAAFACTGRGAQGALPDASRLEAFLAGYSSS